MSEGIQTCLRASKQKLLPTVLGIAQVKDNVAIHVPCTSKKLGVTGAFEQIAALCAKEVTPSGIPCCGRHPSLSSLP